MRIEGEKIYIKPFTKEYAADWVRWTRDEDVIRYSVMRSYTIEEELEYLEEKEKNPDGSVHLSIFLKENNKIIGNCGIHPGKDDLADKTCVGLVIGEKDEWGKGYGTDAMKTLLRYLKEEKGVTEAYLNVDTLNIPAQRVYEKCGFEIVEKRHNPERTNSNEEEYVMRANLDS